MYVCMYACMRVCMYVCLYIYIYIFIYIYTYNVTPAADKSEGGGGKGWSRRGRGLTMWFCKRTTYTRSYI